MFVKDHAKMDLFFLFAISNLLCDLSTGHFYILSPLGIPSIFKMDG